MVHLIMSTAKLDIYDSYKISQLTLKVFPIILDSFFFLLNFSKALKCRSAIDLVGVLVSV